MAAFFSAVAPWLFSGAAFLTIYRFLPNARTTSRSLLLGTAVAAVLFEAAKRLFFWYLGTLARYPLVYGPIAGIIVFMVGVYLVVVLILLGAEVIALRERPVEVSSDD